MRRRRIGSRELFALLVLAIALTASSSVAAGSAAPGSAGSTRAKVWIDSTEPLVVAGSGFAHRERVVVVAGGAGDQGRSVVRTSLAGRFSARFSDISADGCRELTIVARGAAGERAAVKIVPECGTSLGP